MIITTFNVNSVRSRLHILERWLKEASPDMLFMQETKTQDEFFPELAFQEWGYRSFYHGEKSYNGVAVIVKSEIEGVDVKFGFNEGDFASRVLTLRHKDLIILNTYVPQGKDIEHPDFEVKKKFLARVREVIDTEREQKFLWLGDLNVAPTELDVTHPENKKHHVCFCDDIREAFSETKKGLVDVMRLFNANSCVYTFFDYRVKEAVTKNIGWRIDHMLATESLAELAVKCWIDIEPRKWEKPSDHTPLIAEFNL